MNSGPFFPLPLSVVRGVVSGLEVAQGAHEFVQTATDKAVGVSVGASLAATGLPGAATAAMLSVSESAEPVEVFACKVAGEPIAGRFSNIGFANGDLVDAVVERRFDGSLAAFAIRRLSDQTLWMHPHCSRGSRAHWGYVWKMVPLLAVGSLVFVALAMCLANLVSEKKLATDGMWFLFWLMAANALVFSIYFPIRIGCRWRPFVATAERIFAALGYVDPASVDMEKQNSLYWKRHAKPGEHRSGAPWVFRYVDER